MIFLYIIERKINILRNCNKPFFDTLRFKFKKSDMKSKQVCLHCINFCVDHFYHCLKNFLFSKHSNPSIHHLSNELFRLSCKSKHRQSHLTSSTNTSTFDRTHQSNSNYVQARTTCYQSLSLCISNLFLPV